MKIVSKFFMKIHFFGTFRFLIVFIIAFTFLFLIQVIKTFFTSLIFKVWVLLSLDNSFHFMNQKLLISLFKIIKYILSPKNIFCLIYLIFWLFWIIFECIQILSVKKRIHISPSFPLIFINYNVFLYILFFINIISIFEID